MDRLIGSAVAVALVLLAAPFGAGLAQQTGPVQVGTLTCRGGAGSGFILGSVTNLACVLHVAGKPDDRYLAAIQNFAVNFGINIGEAEIALSWDVIAPTPWLTPGRLAGTYGAAAASDGRNLTGGVNGVMALRPSRQQDEVSRRIAEKLGSLELRYDG
ncbi:DUF992 domain-containing protein [Bradyrhizobium ivorense]|uniref:DUF992 domain-containing protein n=1 Tax=Bradyrhizobium ivorense TaxID=2511166 RepID=UPI0010AF6848|nr:DUF992 domain-containing protein [Bradyrhizobium ivorense]VIO71222.1 hypothetical protein CI41S_28930 [Bradyrhizobium ivorense]